MSGGLNDSYMNKAVSINHSEALTISLSLSLSPHFSLLPSLSPLSLTLYFCSYFLVLSFVIAT